MSDRSYREYQTVIAQMVSDKGIRQAAASVHNSDRFRWDAKRRRWLATPCPGCTVITPPFLEETANVATYARLGDIQQALVQGAGATVLAPVPVSSFHLTVADLVWGDTYLRQNDLPGYEGRLIAAITDVFQHNGRLADEAIPALLRGVTAFVSGIVAVVDFPNETDYVRLCALRAAIYEDKRLQALGVYPTGPFTGHITLAYVSGLKGEEDRERLADTLTALNREYFEQPIPFSLVRAEFRRFADMSAYHRAPDWPIFHFTCNTQHERSPHAQHSHCITDVHRS
ncbi:MAG TPA: DUF1868 domain-containing protein [Caldilineae bacterium]|nr:DUF1868 domain-containing protein [Caldilineae bacterium]